MRCEEAREHFADQLNRDVEQSAETALSEHLSACSPCRSEFEELRGVWADLQAIPTPKPDSAAMYASLMASVASVQPKNPRPSSNLSFGRFTMRQATRPIGLIAVSILIAIGAALFFNRCGAAFGCPLNHAENPLTPTTAVPQAVAGHIRGFATARVTLVEYGDYECPPCGSYEPILSKLLQQFPNAVKLEFHHFPIMTIHRSALLAATAAEAAGDQGRYWEMHDSLFALRTQWAGAADAERQFIEMAAKMGLDIDRFTESLRSPETRQRVLDDMQTGRTLQIEGTPTFFLNGQKLSPIPPTVEAFSKVIAAQ
jgi:protein-disulfide isomerase